MAFFEARLWALRVSVCRRAFLALLVCGICFFVLVGWAESSRPTELAYEMVGLEDSAHPTKTTKTIQSNRYFADLDPHDLHEFQAGGLEDLADGLLLVLHLVGDELFQKHRFAEE